MNMAKSKDIGREIASAIKDTAKEDTSIGQKLNCPSVGNQPVELKISSNFLSEKKGAAS